MIETKLTPVKNQARKRNVNINIHFTLPLPGIFGMKRRYYNFKSIGKLIKSLNVSTKVTHTRIKLPKQYQLEPSTELIKLLQG